MAKKENKTVIKRSGDNSKIYCHEPYAQELYDLMYGRTIVHKDLSLGDILQVIDMRILKNNEVEVTCNNFETLYFTIQKERKYLEMLGLDEENFKGWVASGDAKEHFENHKTYVIVENVNTRKGSLHAAHLRTIAREFREQIGKPTSAYSARVISKNQGGFLVEVQGIKAFLPGSLAAANKITNFDDYIGKEIYVMIEDYLASSDIFVVSYKKYLDYILPSKLGELERNQSMVGTVTGSSRFGVFAEFDEIYTGLLHSTEMGPDTLEKFNRGGFKSGETINVWLKDIKDNKLILTETDPSIKQNEMEEFRDKVEGNVQQATIISIKPHGALMEIEKGVLGLLPVKEMKKSGRRLNVGETLNVFIKKVDTSTGKIYLTLTDERIAAEV
jgi:ribosomal protein S1